MTIIHLPKNDRVKMGWRSDCVYKEKGNELLLVGAGVMAIEYAKVLTALDVKFQVVGRGIQSAERFAEETGVEVYLGGIDSYLNATNNTLNAAIIAVGVAELAATTEALIRHGVKRLLVEKPAGVSLSEVKMLCEVATEYNAEVYVAYNRRFYAATLKAQEIIETDGGVKSFNFEFTEWAHLIESLNVPTEVKENWLLANSTHVIDLAFFLGGLPIKMNCYTQGKLAWHSKAAAFAGAGITTTGALFSYQANWDAPGRWGVEILTSKRRLFFRPMEELHVQKLKSVAIEKIILEDELDRNFKPGVFRQVQAFLFNSQNSQLKTLESQLLDVEKIYNEICGQ